MRALKILGLCLGGAYVCATVFVLTLRFTLPPSDLAHNTSPLLIFLDPFVLTVMIPIALIFGVVTFPFTYYAIRDLRLRSATAFVLAVVLAEIVIFTAIKPRFGLVGTVPALAVALAVCRFSGWNIFAKSPANSNHTSTT
jgi:predicted membrane protein